MELLFLLGRILLGGYFVVSGMAHFRYTGMIAGVAESRGLPAPKLGTLISGLMMILGGLGIILGIYVEIAIWLIVIFLVVAAFTIHSFWSVPEEQKMREKMNFQRNMAYIGGLLMILYFSEPWVWTISELVRF